MHNQAGFHYDSCEVAPAVSVLLRLWHVRGKLLYCYILLCSCDTVEEGRGLFSGGWQEQYSTAKKWLRLFHCASLFWCKLQPVLVVQTLEQPSSIVLVSCCRFFQCCIDFAGRLIIPFSTQFTLNNCLSVVLCEHYWCASSAHLTWFTLDAHQKHITKKLHVKSPID